MSVFTQGKFREISGGKSYWPKDQLQNIFKIHKTKKLRRRNFRRSFLLMFRELLLLTVSDGVRLCICGGSDDIGTGDELRELADEQFGYTFAELGIAGSH